MLQAYGATVDIVTMPDPETGDYLTARLRRVARLLEQIEGSFWPRQYANPNNAKSHHNTMREICEQLGSEPYAVFVPVSTCGTIQGCAEFVRDAHARTLVVAVDAAGSLIFGDKSGPRLFPGLGSSVVPPNLQRDMVNEVTMVTDRECVIGCRQLLDKEAVLAGPSAGGVISAIQRRIGRMPRNADVVAILPDRGERYLDTVYSDQWVTDNIGAIEVTQAACSAYV